MLVRRGMCLSVLVACAINLLSWLIPGPIAVLFGAKTDTLIDITKSALPLVCIYILSLSVISPLSVVYQVNSFFLLATLSSLAMIASAALGFVTAQALFKPTQIWLAFPIAAVIAVCFVIAGSMLTRRRIKVKTEPNCGFYRKKEQAVFRFAGAERGRRTLCLCKGQRSSV